MFACIPPSEPREKHHIFPQQEELARWFTSKKIDIHAFTVRVPRSFHSWLHGGGPKGGQWNEAWRQFRRENPGANKEQIWQFAFELMSRFGVNGQLMPYHCP
ncbi:TIGR02269 family lipoprotein [Archangium minus]|uniref:TIGR02269 family lipoprotein n=1 Tax=Archangium minus TaxID=83450 RepID=A0ABY9X9X2_9BACT|nr:TIGR02269 family lipoprotein [Archangium minus]